jgi:hypothetical protein
MGIAIKALMWIYLSLGVLIILAIAFALFIWPMISSGGGGLAYSLDLMEKVLLCWGIILLPFLKVGQELIKRHQREKNAP